MIVSPTRVSPMSLMLAVMKPISPGPSGVVELHRLGREHADPVDLMDHAGAHHPDLLALGERAVLDPGEDHDAEIGIVPAVDQERLERPVRLALGRRQALDDRLQHVVDARPGLGRDQERVLGIEADDVLDLLLDPRRARRPAGRSC